MCIWTIGLIERALPCAVAGLTGTPLGEGLAVGPPRTEADLGMRLGTSSDVAVAVGAGDTPPVVVAAAASVVERAGTRTCVCVLLAERPGAPVATPAARP